MPYISTSSNRLIPLEASRGIAASIVIAHHFFLGFVPSYEPRIIGRWYYVFVNGTGAVHFFFVLSGFVLCWAYFNTADLNRLKEGFFKRLPRLAAPVLVTTIASFCLFYFGLYYFESASKISESTWLASFGGAIRPGFEPSLYEAIRQGLTTFVTGDANYNINLWTMKPEFIGSMVVFMAAAFISIVLSFKYLGISFLLLSLWALGAYADVFPFVAGIFLSAAVVSSRPNVRLPIALVAVLLGIYLLGYAIPDKHYSWAKYLAYLDIRAGNIEIILHSIGACLIIFSIIGNSKIYKSLNGKFCNYLGVFSFPLYLVHTLVICSFSSLMYLLLNQEGYSNNLALSALLILTFAASVLASIPLVAFDNFWLKLVNRMVKKALGLNQTAGKA
ncbi:acyltransferase [Polynucleobacter sp. AP-Latsch-80-C2]|jgi:peptidoglycan/LPS O-acetylase OafA/YrhL|uniref:acyltransferase family protein n=1 Tax=Polynucleobacter sp. AP-Latsch-80-C2 TaxID=2576931 RepID=UPI001C0AE1AC|nr:acyltransferase [Polynucleobacter sp. AP-Latsch-80-C2]MBU3623775.1 acyltransferase [Polynucleobacter sp. AP-Latsch-80-C2]